MLFVLFECFKNMMAYARILLKNMQWAGFSHIQIANPSRSYHSDLKAVIMYSCCSNQAHDDCLRGNRTGYYQQMRSNPIFPSRVEAERYGRFMSAGNPCILKIAIPASAIVCSGNYLMVKPRYLVQTDIQAAYLDEMVAA